MDEADRLEKEYPNAQSYAMLQVLRGGSIELTPGLKERIQHDDFPDNEVVTFIDNLFTEYKLDQQ